MLKYADGKSKSATLQIASQPADGGDTPNAVRQIHLAQRDTSLPDVGSEGAAAVRTVRQQASYGRQASGHSLHSNRHTLWSNAINQSQRILNVEYVTGISIVKFRPVNAVSVSRTMGGSSHAQLPTPSQLWEANSVQTFRHLTH